MKKNVGIIGISGFGKVHLGQLKRLADIGKITIAAAVVINPDDVRDELESLKAYGTEIFPSTSAMYAQWSEKLDLVCIPTGIPFHKAMTCEALENGANVLVEKPAAGSVADIQTMIEAEKKARGKFVCVGFQHIHAREIQYIKQYLLSGRLGKLHRVTAQGLWPRNDSYYHRNNWAGRIKTTDGAFILDSPVNNAFAHYLNLELFLSGETFKTSAHSVSMEAELFRARKEIETFDTCAIRLSTANDVSILLLLSHTVENNYSPEIMLECEKGAVYWKQDDSWNIRNANGKIIASGTAEQPHADMFSDIIQKIEDPSVFNCSLAIAKEHTACIETLYRNFTPVPLEHSAIRRESDGQYILDHVNQIFQTCYLEHKLPSETGVKWS